MEAEIEVVPAQLHFTGGPLEKTGDSSTYTRYYISSAKLTQMMS